MDMNLLLKFDLFIGVIILYIPYLLLKEFVKISTLDFSI